jgi:HSP20 family protein
MSDEHELTVIGGRAATPFEGVSDWLPPVDIVETPTAFEVAIEVCGVSRDDLHASFEEGRLSVWGVRRPSEGETHHYRERRMGRFARAFSFRTPVDEAAVSAKLARGVLTLTVPKRLPRRIALA